MKNFRLVFGSRDLHNFTRVVVFRTFCSARHDDLFDRLWEVRDFCLWASWHLKRRWGGFSSRFTGLFVFPFRWHLLSPLLPILVLQESLSRRAAFRRFGGCQLGRMEQNPQVIINAFQFFSLFVFVLLFLHLILTYTKICVLVSNLF